MDFSEADAAGIVMSWLSAKRPLVATRRHPGMPGDRCPLGLPLPPHLGKRRIGIVVPLQAVDEIRPPPFLDRVIPALPSRWRQSLDTLTRRAETRGIRFRVFGSMAWQYLTGESYVGPQSDVDLLWRPSDLEQMRQGLKILSEWEQESSLRGDGEVVLPDGRAVAWRELVARSTAVLVKGLDSVELIPRARLESMFAAGFPCQTRYSHSA